MSFPVHLRHNLVGRIFFFGAQLLFTTWFIRLLGPHGNGQFVLFTTNAALLALLVGQGMDAAMLYDAARKRHPFAERMRYLYTLLMIQVLLIGAFSGLFQYFFGYAYYGYSSAWGAVYAITLLVNNYGVALWNSEKQFGLVYRVLIGLYAIAFLVLWIMHLCRLQFSEAFLLKYYVGMNGCSGLWFMGKYVFVHRHDMNKILRPVHLFQKEWIRFGQLAFWANLFQYLAYRIDIWMVAFFLDKNQLGMYALAEKIIQTLWMISSSLAAVVFAYADQVTDNKWLSQFQVLIRMVLLGFLLGDVFLLISGQYVISLLFGSAFQDAAKPLWMLLPGASLFVLNILLAAYFAASNLLHLNLINAVMCGIIIGLGDVWLIPRHGIIGAAVASSLGYGISGLWACWMFSRMHRLRWRDWLRGDMYQLFRLLIR
ncbi:MAG: polysaccharide biosynthesis C-terminal domain-containing protein [Thermoflavifilum sp.]|nr:polysaccharide biosynthesis C-terminal domain-containing protein [Thermoflavifilum sp.]